ncbi:hypothetical protein [Mucilaginibacter lappiensis]|uniref:Uncharacterized protein n=1 Tax=Mucilaginibacter lappiensis TaxID=354630 RepID=A0A841JJM9_9SPHI|nr:hypothetical protein [Mucilaginibacter lappiensis]MBB6130482.1 hypothetical protein [Mucilaginibacter lappiensis]
MPKKNQIKIDISRLDIVEILPKTQIINNFPELNNIDAKIKYNIQLNPLYNFDSNIIKIELGVLIEWEDKGQDLRIGEFAYDFIYEYDKLSDITDPNGNITPEIFLTCSNISYSTLRGIIHAKSATTCLEKALLPIVTGSELMQGLYNT